jgi:two-component system, LuxR family, sensor kinase FixL
MTDSNFISVLDAWSALLAATVDAVLVIDHQGQIEIFNAAAERLFGYQAREMLGRNVSVLMPEPDHDSHDRYMQNYLRTHERHIIGIGREVLAKRKDGSVFPAHLSIGEIPTPGPPRFVGLLHDISVRRAALDALQNERDLARRYLEIAQVALMVLDANNRVVLINRKGCEILRRSEVEIVGADWCLLAIPEAQRRAVSEQLAAVRGNDRNEPPEHYDEYEIVDSEGSTRLMAWRGVCMDAGFSGAGTLLLSGDDITERRRAEESARRTADRINEVSRLASLGEMAGGIAHEINQPLTAISNYSQASIRMLAQPATDMADVREALQEISSQALRAGEIIRRLRNLIRKKETQQEPAILDALITDVVGFCASDAKLSEIRITAQVEEQLPELLIDRIQIQQVLFNLLRNAMEAVMVNAPGERTVGLDCERDGDAVRLRITDNGPGVAADFAVRMFTPLQTTKSSGTGLGLAISRSIAEAHQGSLRYIPDTGPGACFELRLPIPNGRLS